MARPGIKVNLTWLISRDNLKTSAWILAGIPHIFARILRTISYFSGTKKLICCSSGEIYHFTYQRSHRINYDYKLKQVRTGGYTVSIRKPGFNCLIRSGGILEMNGGGNTHISISKPRCSDTLSISATTGPITKRWQIHLQKMNVLQLYSYSYRLLVHIHGKQI